MEEPLSPSPISQVLPEAFPLCGSGGFSSDRRRSSAPEGHFSPEPVPLPLLFPLLRFLYSEISKKKLPPHISHSFSFFLKPFMIFIPVYSGIFRIILSTPHRSSSGNRRDLPPHWKPALPDRRHPLPVPTALAEEASMAPQ